MDFSRIIENTALTPSDKLHRMTRLQMSASNSSDYKAISMAICAAHPELHLEYLNSNGEKYGINDR